MRGLGRKRLQGGRILTRRLTTVDLGGQPRQQLFLPSPRTPVHDAVTIERCSAHISTVAYQPLSRGPVTTRTEAVPLAALGAPRRDPSDSPMQWSCTVGRAIIDMEAAVLVLAEKCAALHVAMACGVVQCRCTIAVTVLTRVVPVRVECGQHDDVACSCGLESSLAKSLGKGSVIVEHIRAASALLLLLLLVINSAAHRLCKLSVTFWPQQQPRERFFRLNKVTTPASSQKGVAWQERLLQRHRPVLWTPIHQTLHSRAIQCEVLPCKVEAVRGVIYPGRKTLKEFSVRPLWLGGEEPLLASSNRLPAGQLHGHEH